MDKTQPAQIICRCNKGSTIHLYMISDRTNQEGYMCVLCAHFKPFNRDGEFDATLNTETELRAAAEEELRMRENYEGFLKSVIRSGETLKDHETFEWFCKEREEKNK
jgi:hypothetical protein